MKLQAVQQGDHGRTAPRLGKQTSGQGITRIYFERVVSKRMDQCRQRGHLAVLAMEIGGADNIQLRCRQPYEQKYTDDRKNNSFEKSGHSLHL